MKKIILLAMAVLVIFASGCTGQGTKDTVTGGGNGLEIIDFSIAPEGEVKDSQTTTVKLTIQNQGVSPVVYEYNFNNCTDTATNKYVQGVNCTIKSESGKWFALLIAPTIPTDPKGGDWKFASPGEPGGTATQDYNKTLQPPSKDVEGTSKTFTWRLKAPIIGGTQKIPYKVGAKVYYEYQSDGYVNFNVYPEEQKTIPEKSTMTMDKAPIEVSVKLGRDPVSIADAADGFSFDITVKNVGGGEVHRPDVINKSQTALGENDRGKVDLKIDLPTGLAFEDPSCYKDIDLYYKDADTASCYVTIDHLPEHTENFVVPIKVKFGYTKEVFKSITVVGKRAV